MTEYKHIVQYYETDKMGIAHHSNYVRWMEEARLDFLAKIGWPYAKFEREGIISPVTALECDYKHTTTFPDEVIVSVFLEKYSGVRLKFRYVMVMDGITVFEGRSEHCFLDENGKVVALRRTYPEFDALLRSLAGE